MPIGRSDGCLSTVWYQPRCAVVKTRPLNVIRMGDPLHAAVAQAAR